MLYLAYYDDEDCIQDYMLCDASDEKDAIQKFVEERFSGITICHPECLKAKKVNRPVEDISNALELSDRERDYLADKTFWDWKRAEIDAMAYNAPWFKDDEAKAELAKTERFFRNLYGKLKDGNE